MPYSYINESTLYTINAHHLIHVTCAIYGKEVSDPLLYIEGEVPPVSITMLQDLVHRLAYDSKLNEFSCSKKSWQNHFDK